jgi:hypothetical protein
LIAHVVVTSPGNPPIVGTVSFYSNGNLLGTEPVSDGYASLFLGVLPAGSQTFSAGFSGSGTSSTSGSTITVGSDGPQVTRVLRYGFHAQSTFLVIDFNSALDVTSAQEVANYHIVAPCGRRIKVGKAVYDPITNTVTLKTVDRLNIHHSYKMRINGTSSTGVAGSTGLLLDGAGTGEPGSNYVTSLTWRNLAGSARQLPTRNLLVAGVQHSFRAERASRGVAAAGPAAAVDLVLAAGPMPRRK